MIYSYWSGSTAAVKPPHELPTDILKIWVNDQLAFEEGKVTEARTGEEIKNK